MNSLKKEEYKKSFDKMDRTNAVMCKQPAWPVLNIWWNKNLIELLPYLFWSCGYYFYYVFNAIIWLEELRTIVEL
jgi:hypothetical protein